MTSQAQKYFEYARECFRLAEQASDTTTRSKLLELAGVWNDAALLEEQIAQAAPRMDALAGEAECLVETDLRD